MKIILHISSIAWFFLCCLKVGFQTRHFCVLHFHYFLIWNEIFEEIDVIFFIDCVNKNIINFTVFSGLTLLKIHNLPLFYYSGKGKFNHNWISHFKFNFSLIWIMYNEIKGKEEIRYITQLTKFESNLIKCFLTIT